MSDDTKQEWEAVFVDGTRILIIVARRERPMVSIAPESFVGSVLGVPRGRAETPVLAAHETVTLLLREGHDVRDLVRAGQPSRAELTARIAELEAYIADEKRRADDRSADVARLFASLDDMPDPPPDWRDRPPTLAEVRAHEASGDGFAAGDWIYQPMSIVADELSPEVWHISAAGDDRIHATYGVHWQVGVPLPEGRWWCWRNGPIAWPEVTT